MAEIRQKDAIIETLLKQLHNPYLATPHSIDGYLKSISPSDANNPIVLGLLGRLKSSVQMGMGSSTEETSEGDSSRLTHDQRYNLLAHSEAQEYDEMPTAITEFSHVPVGFRPECEAQKISPLAGPGMFHHCCVSIKYTDVKLTCPGFRQGNSMGLNSPEILVLGLVTLEDAEQLFDM